MPSCTPFLCACHQPVQSSHSDTWQYAMFHREWAELENQKIHILSLRSSNQQVRACLRERQSSKLAAEDRLFQRIYFQETLAEVVEIVPQMSENSVLELLQDLQNLRDEYGILEYDYEQQESKLSQEEFNLHMRQDAFFTRWNIIPNLQHNSVRMQDPQSISVQPFDTDPDEDDFPYHPLVIEFLSRKGDLDILREQLFELEEEKDNLEALEESRRLDGSILSQKPYYYTTQLSSALWLQREGDLYVSPR